MGISRGLWEITNMCLLIVREIPTVSSFVKNNLFVCIGGCLVVSYPTFFVKSVSVRVLFLERDKERVREATKGFLFRTLDLWWSSWAHKRPE